MSQGDNIQKIPAWSIFGRVFFGNLLNSLFPVKKINKNNTLEKIRQAAISGKGTILIFTHFSLRDAMEVNRSVIFTDKVLKNRPVVNPLSFHQFNKPMEIMAKFFNGDFAPIVNQSTIAKKRFQHLSKGQGLDNFVKMSASVLQKGGLVTLAVNATRKEKLDLNDTQKPIGFLLASLMAKNVKNIGIALVALGIENAKSYSKKEVGGMNLGKVCTITTANYFTLEEILNKKEVNNKIGNVDNFIRSEFAKVVPKEYL